MDQTRGAQEALVRDPGAAVREVGPREALQIANGLQQRGEFDAAESIYLAVLAMLPEQADALHFLGVLRHQQGRDPEALGLIVRAIECDPLPPGPWLNLANVLLESGQFERAVDALRGAIERAPQLADAHNNLGVLHTRLGNWQQAEQALLRGIELAPALGYLHFNLAHLYFRTGRSEQSTELLLQSLALDAGNPAARSLLSRAYLMLGDREHAVQVLRDWLNDEPDNPQALHHLAAAGAAPMPRRASDAYVERVFDRFADSFDAKLESLGYRAPQVVAEALAALGDARPRAATVLDAGCGTGLCAPLLRPCAARLEGVDLSGGMLERARGRGGYDALHRAELTAFLAAAPARYDIIASADTFNYFGDLDPVLLAAAGALRAGGVLVATLEALPDGDEPLRLEVHGRYAHSQDYLKAALERAGLRLAHLEQQVLRREGGQLVHGWVFAAFGRRPPAA